MRTERKIKWTGMMAYAAGAARVRHLRGHGIHSPFVYSIVRDVFMPRSLTDTNHRELYDTLRGLGVWRRYARQIQNLYTHCGFSSFRINDRCGGAENCLFVMLPEYAALQSDMDSAWRNGNAVVVMHSHDTYRQARAIRDLIYKDVCLSIDNRGYTVFFNNDKLPVNHFKL
jgi:hypothetical protein